MIRAIKVLVVCLILSSGAVADCQLLGPLQVLPVVAKVSGADGSNWLTTVTLANAGDSTLLVTALFFRENEEGSLLPLPGSSRIFSLDPGITLTVEDVLSEWFPSQGDTKGSLLLFALPLGGGEGETALLSVSARIYNAADPAFTYGQAVPSGLLNVAAGGARSILPGARWDERARSNVGVVNLSVTEITVIVTVRAADGAVLAQGPRQVAALSMSQWSLSQLGVGDLSAPGRVEVMLDPASVGDECPTVPDDFTSEAGAFIAYISRVDRGSGDAEFLLGQNDWSVLGEECELPFPR